MRRPRPLRRKRTVYDRVPTAIRKALALGAMAISIILAFYLGMAGRMHPKFGMPGVYLLTLVGFLIGVALMAWLWPSTPYRSASDTAAADEPIPRHDAGAELGGCELPATNWRGLWLIAAWCATFAAAVITGNMIAQGFAVEGLAFRSALLFACSLLGVLASWRLAYWRNWRRRTGEQRPHFGRSRQAIRWLPLVLLAGNAMFLLMAMFVGTVVRSLAMR